jgi:hypothetical protein
MPRASVEDLSRTSFEGGAGAAIMQPIFGEPPRLFGFKYHHSVQQPDLKVVVFFRALQAATGLAIFSCCASSFRLLSFPFKICLAIL